MWKEHLTVPSKEVDSSVSDELHGLLLDQCNILEDAVIDLVERRLDDDARERARVIAHRLSGSAGTVGFPAASVAARDLTHLFDGPINPSVANRAAELVERLRADLTDAVEVPASNGVTTTTVHLFGHEEKFARSLAAAGSVRRMKCVTVEEAKPDYRRMTVALVDLAAPGNDEMRHVEALARRDVSVIAMVPHDDIERRLAALRAGATAVIGSPTSIGLVLDALEEIAGHPYEGPPTVLVGPGGNGSSASVDTLLDTVTARHPTAENVHAFWEALEEYEPDLVVLPSTGDDVACAELCRAIRTDPQWWMTPVAMFVSADGDVSGARRSGADDVIDWPGDIAEVTRRIRMLIGKSRRLRRHGGRDTVTGLATRGRLEEEMPRLIAVADRYEAPLSLAVIEMDGFQSITARHGRPFADALVNRIASLLREGFRDEDIPARLGESTFAIALYGMTRADGVQRIADTLDALRSDPMAAEGHRLVRATFSAGIAQWSQDGDNLAELAEAAGRAMRRAQSLGGDRVLPVGWENMQVSDGIDVVVIEDDEALSGVLLHALKVRGHQSAWFADGREAVDRLTSGGPDHLSPKVIILDHDLPGLNGTEVLTELDRHGVLNRTKVIMLTVRGTETEVLEMLRAGATDHVAKPFSMPVLMQRLRRVMNVSPGD